MCQTRTRITDLHHDVLKLILKKVAKTPDGAASFARIMSISKEFNVLAKDEDVLRAVDFRRCSALSHTYEPFWDGNGLLARCARAGKIFARFLLHLHIIYLMDSAEIKMKQFTSATEICENFIKVSERQEYTRIISVIELLNDSIDRELQSWDAL